MDINKTVREIALKDTYNDIDEICRILIEHDEYISINSLHTRTGLNIPLPTIYRKVKILEDIGAIESVTIPGEGKEMCWHEASCVNDDSF